MGGVIIFIFLILRGRKVKGKSGIGGEMKDPDAYLRTGVLCAKFIS